MPLTNAIAIIGLLLGVAIMVVFSMKGLHVIPLTLMASAAVCIFNGIDIWTGLSTSWAAGVGGTFTSYFLLFFASTCFAGMMETTGCCVTIAQKFIDWFGTKHILTVMILFVFLLTYGGISFFVVTFSVAPIIFSLFSELNIPRKLAMIPLAAGGASWSYAAPGSTQLANVIPTSMGTSLMSAPILGFVMCAAGLLLCILYAEREYKKEMGLVASGAQLGWDGTVVERSDRAQPGTIRAFLPLLIVIAFIVILSFSGLNLNATLLAVLAMICGFLVCLLLNRKYIDGPVLPAIQKIMRKGSLDSSGSALTLGAVIGFGTVVSSTASFQAIVEWLMSLDLSAYVKGVLSTSVIASVSGSASSGARLCVQYLGGYFAESGCDLGIMHRLISFASITFDSLPHASGCFIMTAALGLTHKNAYKYIFMTCTVFTTIIIVVTMLGILCLDGIF